MHSRLVVPAVALCLWTMPGSSSADSATVYSFTDGRTVAPLGSEEIVMSAETVAVAPAGAPTRWFDRQRVSVDCVFHFVNTGDEPVTSEVGFPFESFARGDYIAREHWDAAPSMDRDMADAIEQGIPPDSLIPAGLDFVASVNGVEVPVRFRYGTTDPEARMVFWPMWAVWDMTFPPGRDVVLRCSYETGYNFHEYTTFRYDFTYIMRTGALWKGPIGTALVTFTVPDSIPMPSLEAGRSCWWEWTGSPEVSGRTLRWEREDWEPDTDLGLRVFGVRPPQIQTDRMELRFSPDTAFDWSSAEGLFSSAVRFREQLGIVTDALSLLPILREASRQEQAWLPGGLDCFDADGLPHPSWAPVLGELEEMLHRESDAVEEAGYGPLLPMFSARMDWQDANLAMFEADPSLQARYLAALEKLDDALAGVAPEDPVLHSFYRLTGWFEEGRRAVPTDLFGSEGFGPGYPRDSVLSWWETAAAVPLVEAVASDRPRSGQPFAFVSPSPPFPDSPHVNSVLNDDEELTGWRAGLSGAGHGEVMEAYVFPLPDGEVVLHGFSLVNGFGDSDGPAGSKISKLLVRVDGNPVCTVQLRGGWSWQTVELDAPLRGVRSLTFEIIEAVPGEDNLPAGISELRLF